MHVAIHQLATSQQHSSTPADALVRGLAAAALGTLAMDVWLYARYRRNDGKSGFRRWEFSADLLSWDQAPAPAQVGKRLYEGLFQRELPDHRAALRQQHHPLGIRDCQRPPLRHPGRVPPHTQGPLRGSVRRRRLVGRLPGSSSRRALRTHLEVQPQGAHQGPDSAPGLRPQYGRGLPHPRLRPQVTTMSTDASANRTLVVAATYWRDRTAFIRPARRGGRFLRAVWRRPDVGADPASELQLGPEPGEDRAELRHPKSVGPGPGSAVGPLGSSYVRHLSRSARPASLQYFLSCSLSSGRRAVRWPRALGCAACLRHLRRRRTRRW